MFRDSPYASDRGSFRTPVPVPLQDPDAAPTVSVALNCDWLPYVRGALLQLVLQATWDTQDPAQLLITQQRAMTLLAMFEDCVSPPYACFQSFLQLTEPTGYTIRTDEGGDTGHLGQFLPILGYTATTNRHTSPDITATGIYLYRDFSPAVHLSAFDLSFALTKGGGSVAQPTGVLLSNAGTLYNTFEQDWRAYPDGNDLHLVGTQAAALTDRIYIQMLCQDELGSVASSGELTFKSFVYQVANTGECQQS